MRASRGIQTVSSTHGSEATFHGAPLHRPLLCLCLMCPFVSLLNGTAAFLFWKPSVVSAARNEQFPFPSGTSVSVNPRYYVFVLTVFVHFALGHTMVVQRGVRALVGQRTSARRQTEAHQSMAIFMALTLPLFIAHYVLYEDSNISYPSVDSRLDDSALAEAHAAVGFVRFVMWGTLLVFVLVGWYWWASVMADKLQRGVRRVADEARANRRALDIRWQVQLKAGGCRLGSTAPAE